MKVDANATGGVPTALGPKDAPTALGPKDDEPEKEPEAEPKQKQDESDDEDEDDLEVPEGDYNVIEGSERVQQFYYDEMERSIYVGDTKTADDSFASELVVALRRAMPLLWHVDSFLLEAMFRCAITDGAQSIPKFLETRDISVDS